MTIAKAVPAHVDPDVWQYFLDLQNQIAALQAAVAAFPKPVDLTGVLASIATINTQVATLSAQVAALTAAVFPPAPAPTPTPTPAPAPTPTPSPSSGSLVHGAAFTISGSFGEKVVAAPLVWDDCSGADVLSKWSGFWPDGAPTASSNMGYQSAGLLGIQPPHNRVGKYLTGAHESSGNFHTGQDVAVWKDFNKVEGGHLYLSYYSFVNPGWVFSGGMLPEDGNFKTFGYSRQGSIYEMPYNWYEAIWDDFGVPLARGLWSAAPSTVYSAIINDDSGLMFGNGPQYYGPKMINPLGGAWVKREVFIGISSTSNGYITIKENNGLGVAYKGVTDPYPDTARSAGPGGFARACNSVLNRRYFADLYMDTSFARVMLVQGAVNEPQPITTWSDTFIIITGNLGKVQPGAANLVVFNDANVQVASIAVTV